GIGQPARVLQGETQLEGALAGLTARGELELDTPSGRRVVAAGDVFFSSAV
ncbi:MAG TPA: biotin--[acetyl-CoA-carboxylase] ligase, partial [Hyphomonadaceae bacterium]|nr:biotin--[acetyl-CoA-carboxylase] ligase [Hyphomonadaceae bacterium]